jgi:hypothetical protein
LRYYLCRKHFLSGLCVPNSGGGGGGGGESPSVSCLSVGRVILVFFGIPDDGQSP